MSRRLANVVIVCAGVVTVLSGCANRQIAMGNRGDRIAKKETITPGEREGTVLRILCDIPDEVGRDEQVYRGRIDWAHGSEPFDFTVADHHVDVPLAGFVTLDEPIRMTFIVDAEPPGPTRFHANEWFYHGWPGWAQVANGCARICVRLSAFRDADLFSSVRRP